jgi:FMN phosphatase YigB (HAD superfamily)
MNDLTMLKFPTDALFYIQACEETTYHKPHPDVFKPILKKLKENNIKKEEVVYVGDSLMDYCAARDAGLQFYGIPGRTTSKETFEHESVQTIASLKDLQKLF